MNSGGNVYFCFCGGDSKRLQREAHTPEQQRTPEHSPDRHGGARGGGAAAAAECEATDGGGLPSALRAALSRRRAASDDGAVRRLSGALQRAADGAPAPDHDSDARREGHAGRGGESVAAAGADSSGPAASGETPPRELPPRPRSAAAALPPERQQNGVLRQAEALQQPAQQQAAQVQRRPPERQPSGQAGRDGSSLPPIPRQRSGTLPQAAERDGSSGSLSSGQRRQQQPQQHAEQQGCELPADRQHSGTSQTSSEVPNGGQSVLHGDLQPLDRHHTGPAQSSAQRQHSSGELPPLQGLPVPVQRLLVVKFLPARLDAQSEQFASELARHLGVPSPACRILRKQV